MPLYLRKANDDLVSHCRCSKSEALISSPAQMDCPWCGCGWLFICSRCRKAFTFAEAFETSEPLKKIGEQVLLQSNGESPTKKEVTDWTEWMKILLKGIKTGQQYVYFDGWMISTSEKDVHIDGWHSRHDLDFLPHVSALAGDRLLPEILGSTEYWHSTHVEDEG